MIDYTEGAAAYAKQAETKEQRKQRLATARREYRAKINRHADTLVDMARMNEGESQGELTDANQRKRLADDALSCRIAAAVLRDASIAQVKRAVAYVNKQNRGKR